MKQSCILKNGKEITINQLELNQLDEILMLQQKVIESLSTESFLQPLTEEEYNYILTGKGSMIGAFYDEKLIAFRAMLEPEIDEAHLGKDAGIPKNEWHRVLYSEITNVDSYFRGNNLQELLGEILFKSVDEERFRYICATVAPFNIASLKDKFTQGMQIVSLKVKYGDLLRYVLLKDHMQPIEGYHFTESRIIVMENTEEQQQYLQKGWIGTGIEKLDEQWVVRFEK